MRRASPPRRTANATREVPTVKGCDLQPDAREGKVRAVRDGGEARSTDEAVNHRGERATHEAAREREGALVEGQRKKRQGTRRLAMSLTPPQSVQKLQTALHAKAKGSPGYRFYALYDKVYRKDVLGFAYACCKSNKGAPGWDEQTFQDIETYGLERWLGELTAKLKSRRYQAEPVLRVYIPKPDGKKRPLGIPAIRD